MWVGVVIPILVLGYVGYRLSLTVRAIQADRAGDRDRADAFRTKGSVLFLGVTAALMLLILVVVAAALIATR